MCSHNLHIRNESSKPQTYCVYLEDVYILESYKNVLVVPKVDPGGSRDFEIDSNHYVWAKLSASSEMVFEAVDIGSAVAVSAMNGKPAIARANDLPNQGCFAITVDESFSDNGLFGLGVRTTAGLRQLTTKIASQATTYHVRPSTKFEVAVNKHYQDGNKLRSASSTTASVKFDLLPGTHTVTVSHRGSVAEELFIGDDPATAQTRSLQEDAARAKTDARSKSELIESLKSEIEKLKTDFNASKDSGKQERQQLNEQLRLAAQDRLSLQKRFDEFRDSAAAAQRDLTSQLNSLRLADAASELLKRNGYDPGSRYLDIPAALRWAATNGHSDAVSLLLQKGSAANTADSDGVTAAHLAARRGHTAIVKQLLSAGAPIEARMHRIDNSTDRSHGTPLHWAAIEGHVGPMTALLDSRAHVDARNAWNRTPLHVVARFGHEQAVRLLVGRGADKEARRDTNETPLHFAVEENRYSIVSYLLGAGADVNAWGNRGTPLKFANSLGRAQIAQLLRSWGARP